VWRFRGEKASSYSDVVRTGDFGNFGRHIFAAFRVEANIITQRTKCLIGFPVTLKCLTLNDLDVPFYTKICFHRGVTRFFCLAFGDNYVKTNEDTAIQSATKLFARDSSFRGMSLIRYGSRVIIKGGVVESGQFSMPLVAMSRGVATGGVYRYIPKSVYLMWLFCVLDPFIHTQIKFLASPLAHVFRTFKN